MRELRVEDALLYLDQVKMEFGDRPHIYNEFLDIMKTFKTQQLDTPGVIRRVSSLFQGNRRLVLGFNTFLPEGYKIELPLDGDGPPVAVYRAPGQSGVTHILGPAASLPGSQPGPMGGTSSNGPTSSSAQPPSMMPQQPSGPSQQGGSGNAAAPPRASLPPHQMHTSQPPIRSGGGGGGQQQPMGRGQPGQPGPGQQQGGPPGGMTVDQSSGANTGPYQQQHMPHVAHSQQQAMHMQQQAAQRGQQQQMVSGDAATRMRLSGDQQGRGSGRADPPLPSHLHPQGGMSQAVGVSQPNVGTDVGRTTGRMTAGGPAPRMPPHVHPQGGTAQNVGATQASVGTDVGGAPGRMSTGGPAPRMPGGDGSPHSVMQPMGHPHGGPAQVPAAPQLREPPVEFDHAINYVTTIKKRFASEPETYKKFLEILHTYQKEQRGIKEVLDEVSVLFAEHPDLLKEFTYFLPDAVQAQAKAQLDQVAKESEARKRAASSKQAIMQTAQGMQRQAHSTARPQPQPPTVVASSAAAPAPQVGRPASGTSVYTPAPVPMAFGATQGRSDERERDICRAAIYGSVSFSPVRPPRRNELTPAQAALKNGRPQMIPELPIEPTNAEAAFFHRAKIHLFRKELAPDKPPGSRRHTPYAEFLKCLHLFGAEVLNKEELVLLLRGLFMQGHAPKSGANAGGGASNPSVANDAQDLLKEFEEILVGRGPYAKQESAAKDKSKYGAIPTRDYDFSQCERPTPSYRTFPSDYPHNVFYCHSGQSAAESAVLNRTLLCVGPERSSKKRMMYSPEDYDGVKIRRNANEEALFKVEDERFEVDMAIDRNVNAMREVEPLAEEVTDLRANEEKDGQPIGRMHYKPRKRSLNITQINAIARIYGDSGDEVLQHLLRNPVAVLPIVYTRLRQKDAEWRKTKNELTKRWNAICEANYEGSLDVLCYSYRKELERSFATDRLVEECRRTRHLVKHPRRNADHPATRLLRPNLNLSSRDDEALLFQPCVRVPFVQPYLHKDVYQLVSNQVASKFLKSKTDRERVARIWAEMMGPWFRYPAYWIANELRESYTSDEGTCTVKYAPGQRVRTAYGDGQILSKMAANNYVKMRYKVKLPFGIGYIRPASVIYVLPGDGDSSKKIRRNGVMESVELLDASAFEVDKRYRLMFSTEKGYIFMRLYCLLLIMLTDTQLRWMRKEAGQVQPLTRNTTNGSNVGTPFDKQGFKSYEAMYSYRRILSTLKKLSSGEMDAKDFEIFCRKITDDKVYELLALPKLIEQCAEAIVKVAKEDAMLSLHDLSQLNIRDPERLRILSYAETTDACYRIQFDPLFRLMYFCYLAPGDQVLLTRVAAASGDMLERAHEDDKDFDDDDAPMDEEEEDVVEDVDEDDEDATEVEDPDIDLPNAKRSKLK